MARFWRHNERLSPYDDNAFTDEELESIADTVRESSFIDDVSGKSIDERMTDFFGGFEPGWIGFQSPDGVCYVNCYGALRDGRRAIRVELQFELSDDLEDFALTGLCVNGKPQPERAVAAFEARFSDEPEDDPFDSESGEYYDGSPEDDVDGDYCGYDMYEVNDYRDDDECGCVYEHRETPRRELFDFDADAGFVEPQDEEPDGDRRIGVFGQYGAFPVVGKKDDEE